MEHLHKLITDNIKYELYSSNKEVTVTFENNEFTVERNLDHKCWMGIWYQSVDTLQLLYQYELYGYGKLLSINGFKQSKVKYDENKWIFDENIFYGTDNKIFLGQSI